MLRKLVLSSPVLLVLTLSLVVSVEADSTMWSQTYGGTKHDEAHSLVVTSDGGYALSGNTLSFGAGSSDFWLVKTDEFGNMEWNQTYGYSDWEWCASLVATSDGGYALAGLTQSVDSGDALLVKTDSFGNMEWNRTYGGTGWQEARGLVETFDGGYALAGSTDSLGAGQSDWWLVKTDAFGNVEWNQTFGGTRNDYVYSMVQTSDGGYALAGLMNSSDLISNPGGDFWLVKTDGAGNMEWNKTYGETGDEIAMSLVETSDGGYALAGEKGNDIWLIKTDAVGNMEWNQTYSGTGYALIETSDGGYAIAGTIHSSSTGSDCWFVKTDVYGNMEWNKTYEGPQTDKAWSIVQTSDGGYAIAGETDLPSTVPSDFWLIKTDEYGIVPEYSSWLLPTLLLTATLVIVVSKKKLLKPRSQVC